MQIALEHSQNRRKKARIQANTQQRERTIASRGRNVFIFYIISSHLNIVCTDFSMRH